MTVRLAALGVLMAVMGFLLSELGFRGKRLFSVLCAVLILATVGEGIAELFGIMTELEAASGASEAVACAMKIVGASYLFGVCADIASEMGEGGIASALGAAYRVELLLLVLPYLRELVTAAAELISRI